MRGQWISQTQRFHSLLGRIDLKCMSCVRNLSRCTFQMASSGVFEWIWWLNPLLTIISSWCGDSVRSLWFSCSPFPREAFSREHILGTLWVLNFDVPSACRLMGVILTFLPCKVPSNLSLHKELSQFPGHLSEICFSEVSIPVSYRLCRDMWTLIWMREMPIDFWLLFWRHFGFNSKPIFKRRDRERLLYVTCYFCCSCLD